MRDADEPRDEANTVPELDPSPGGNAGSQSGPVIEPVGEEAAPGEGEANEE